MVKANRLSKHALKKLGKLSSDIERTLTKTEKYAGDNSPNKFNQCVWTLMQAWGALDYYVYKHSTTKKQRAKERAKYV